MMKKNSFFNFFCGAMAPQDKKETMAHTHRNWCAACDPLWLQSTSCSVINACVLGQLPSIRMSLSRALGIPYACRLVGSHGRFNIGYALKCFNLSELNPGMVQNPGPSFPPCHLYAQTTALDKILHSAPSRRSSILCLSTLYKCRQAEHVSASWQWGSGLSGDTSQRKCRAHRLKHPEISRSERAGFWSVKAWWAAFLQEPSVPWFDYPIADIPEVPFLTNRQGNAIASGSKCFAHEQPLGSSLPWGNQHGTLPVRGLQRRHQTTKTNGPDRGPTLNSPPGYGHDIPCESSFKSNCRAPVPHLQTRPV